MEQRLEFSVMQQGTQLGAENKARGRKRQERIGGHGRELPQRSKKDSGRGLRVMLRAQSGSTLSPGYLRLLHIRLMPIHIPSWSFQHFQAFFQTLRAIWLASVKTLTTGSLLTISVTPLGNPARAGLCWTHP